MTTKADRRQKREGSETEKRKGRKVAEKKREKWSCRGCLKKMGDQFVRGKDGRKADESSRDSKTFEQWRIKKE